MDSTPEWRKRRNGFRHPFNPSSLKSFEVQLNSLLDKLDQHLHSAGESKQVIKIDELFGRFALDVIYKLAFDLDCNFMDNSDKYKVRAYIPY